MENKKEDVRAGRIPCVSFFFLIVWF